MNSFTHRSLVFGILTFVVGLFCTVGVGSTEAQTAKPANPIVSVNAREQSLTAFLNELLGAAGYSTVISSAVEGRVSGRFNGRLDAILSDLSRKQAITFYRTGKIVYVYRTGEIGARILSTKPAQAERLTRVARKLGMFDDNNFLARADNGTVVAVGTPRFLDQLDELADADRSDSAAVKTDKLAKTQASSVMRPQRSLISAMAPVARKRPKTASAKLASGATQAPATGQTAASAPSAASATATAATTASLGANGSSSVAQSANLANPLPTALPDLTPAVVESVPVGSGASTLVAQSSTAERPVLRPRIVWRSAYAPPERAEVFTR
jgi:type II secretory pathway component GspD/PulD (secretin)